MRPILPNSCVIGYRDATWASQVWQTYVRHFHHSSCASLIRRFVLASAATRL